MSCPEQQNGEIICKNWGKKHNAPPQFCQSLFPNFAGPRKSCHPGALGIHPALLLSKCSTGTLVQLIQLPAYLRTEKHRRHRWNWMHQKRDDLGPPVFEEVSKMPPALMKAFGVGNFTRSAWSILSKGQKELRGWDFCKARVKINDSLGSEVSRGKKPALTAHTSLGLGSSHQRRLCGLQEKSNCRHLPLLRSRVIH